jgi:quinoprotein dehydrogenase-associated probable ABC transporter substrate-binding protein
MNTAALRRAALGAGLLAAALGAGAQTATAPAGPAGAPDEPPRQALRVCVDPNNLPFSSTSAQGIENRIADVFGQALQLPVSYYAFPNRMAFIRNTLRYKLPGADYPCDIVMGVPVGFDQVSVTAPYYRSSYAMVFAPGQGLEGVHSAQDLLALPPAVLGRLRIGIYDRSPASLWLSRHGLIDRGVPYKMMSPDPEQYPGEIIERDLAAGKLDLAIVWGPIGGYFAQRVKSPALRVVPMKSEPGVKLDYEIAMGVRYGERAWKQQVEALLVSQRTQIQAILQEFGVPLVDESYSLAKPQ